MKDALPLNELNVMGAFRQGRESGGILGGLKSASSAFASNVKSRGVAGALLPSAAIRSTAEKVGEVIQRGDTLSNAGRSGFVDRGRLDQFNRPVASKNPLEPQSRHKGFVTPTGIEQRGANISATDRKRDENIRDTDKQANAWLQTKGSQIRSAGFGAFDRLSKIASSKGIDPSVVESGIQTGRKAHYATNTLSTPMGLRRGERTPMGGTAVRMMRADRQQNG
jgi:hypothetical protein